MFRRAFLVALAACGGRAAAVAPPPPPAPIELCADGATPGATGAALLDAAEVALERGCAKEALLDAIAAGDAAPAGRLAYVRLAATAQVRADLLVGGAWIEEGYPAVSRDYAAVARSSAWRRSASASPPGSARAIRSRTAPRRSRRRPVSPRCRSGSGPARSSSTTSSGRSTPGRSSSIARR